MLAICFAPNTSGLLQRAFALGLAATDKALALQRAEGGGDDGALALAAIAIVKEHHPVVGLAQFMGARGVGEQGGVMPCAAQGVQHGQPGFAGGIEAFGRDELDAAFPGVFTILPVHIEKLGDGRLAAGLAGWQRGGGRLVQPAKAMGEGVADAGEPLLADACQLDQAAIMRGDFQFLQGLEAQLLVQLPGGLFADAGDGVADRR